MTIIEFILAHADDITAVVAALTAFGGLWYSIIKFFAPLLKNVNKSFKDLATIAEEFRPNGGSTLRDAINRLEVNVEGIRADAIRMEARQWAIVSTLRDPIFEADSAGECVRANPAYLNLVERSLEDVLGNGWENTLHPDDRKRVWEDWHDAVLRLRSYEGSFKIRSASGVIYQVSCVAVPYFSSDDRSVLIGYLGRFESVKRLKITEPNN